MPDIFKFPTQLAQYGLIDDYDKENVVKALGSVQKFMEMQQLYNGAIREVTTKLEILNEEFRVRYDHNPIHHIESRQKSPDSIAEKLLRKGYPVNIESAMTNLNDIAGVRVICFYLDDINRMADLLLSQSDIQLVEKRDYVSTPKDNGYRSLHLIVRVPVFLSTKTEMPTVEVQIRTIAMDLWASLEHPLRYKSVDRVPDEIRDRLKQCADTSAELDRNMQDIYHFLKDKK